MGPASVIILCIFLAVVAAAIFYVLISRAQATRLGLPPPPITSYIPFWPEPSNSLPYANNTSSSSSSGGIKGWFGKFKKNNNRTAAGAYEPSGANANAARSRGFGPLDPDEAWDARVGQEADGYGPAYYEETELQPPRHNNLGDDTSYGGSSYQMNLATNSGNTQPGTGTSNPFADPEEERGRRRSRSPGPAANKGLNAPAPQNPFDDAAADHTNVSMRGVSPRPIEGTGAPKPSGHNNGEPETPVERRSIFREDV